MTDSLTNLEAVKPRGPKVFAAIFLVVMLGAAAWFVWGREAGPIGEPEDPSKILVVGDRYDAAAMVAQLGFDVETGTLEALANQGRERGAPDGADDVDAILHLADMSGQGYVVFTDPSSIEFGTRPVSADSGDVTKHHRYAVFSVGTFAEPMTKVTVDRQAEQPYELPAHAEMIRALFDQEKLAATLIAKSNLSMEAQPLYERIRHAVKLKGAYGMIDQRAKGLLARAKLNLEDHEEADPKPTVLTRPLERGDARALANGRRLLLLRSATIQHPLDERAELYWPETALAWAEDPKSGERVRCPELDAWATGYLQFNDRNTVALVRRVDEPSEVFILDEKAPGCGFELRGSFKFPLGSKATLSSTGRVAQTDTVDDEIVLEVHEPNEDAPRTWPLPGCTSVGAPGWLDAKRVGVVCTYTPPEEPIALDDDLTPVEPPETIPASSWLYIMDVDAAQTLALPLPKPRAANQVLARPGDTARLLALTSWARGAIALDFDLPSWDTVFATPPKDPALARPPFVTDEAAGVVALDPTLVKQQEFDWLEEGQRPVVSPDGKHLALEVDNETYRGSNVAVVDLDAGTLERVATNARVEHEWAHFTADGQHVIFGSKYEDLDVSVVVAQIVDVP